MRYEDWDVILFPRDSHVPIQEFKTACYSSQDASKWSTIATHDRTPASDILLTTQIAGGSHLPTLTCYVCSLPPSTPFRVSIHSWASTSRPSATIESQRKPDQKIMYMCQVVVDGSRVL